MKIYVASSWRNELQPFVVGSLRALGHDVYDFRDRGFNWSQVDPGWQGWTSCEFRDALGHEIANAGFRRDFEAMRWANFVLLLMPCGRSAHLELGWAAGAGKQTGILLYQRDEPELMYKMVDHIFVGLGECLGFFQSYAPEAREVIPDGR